jgi:hypothetical protein
VVPTLFNFHWAYLSLVTLILCFTDAIYASMNDTSYFKFVSYAVVIIYVVSIILNLISNCVNVNFANYFEYSCKFNAALVVTRNISILSIKRYDHLLKCLEDSNTNKMVIIGFIMYGASFTLFK